VIECFLRNERTKEGKKERKKEKKISCTHLPLATGIVVVVAIVSDFLVLPPFKVCTHP